MILLRYRRQGIWRRQTGSGDIARCRRAYIYAFRADLPQHAVSKRWLDDVVTADAQFGFSPLALSAAARITTNARAFRKPSTLDEVFAYRGNLLSQPHCQIVQPGERHWTIFSRLCRSTATQGPRITDAWFAALAIEHGCTWITFDRGYARFRELDWREPDG